MLLIAEVFRSVSRLTVAESEVLMRLGIEELKELEEFEVLAQLIVVAGVTVDVKVPGAPMTELC